MTLSEIESNLKDNLYATNPHGAAEARSILSGYYSTYAGALEAILTTKATAWLKIREACKSDKQADKMWDASSEGIEEMKLRSRLKAMEKMMGSLSGLLRVAEGQSRNQF
jgi:hypothetical protein